MKHKLTLFTSCLVLLTMLTASKSGKQNQLIGKWTLVSSLINEKSAPAYLMNRTMEFDNTHFVGKITRNGQELPYNGGKYFIANDSTVITINQRQNGRLSSHSFTYNFKIEGDSLHFYGYYYSRIQGNPGSLKTMYNDEKWVRSTQK